MLCVCEKKVPPVELQLRPGSWRQKLQAQIQTKSLNKLKANQNFRDLVQLSNNPTLLFAMRLHAG